MKKFHLKKRYRQLGIGLATMAAVGFAALILLNLKDKAETPLTETVLDYQIEAVLTPSVKLKPNSIYSVGKLTEKDLIVNRLVENVESVMDLSIVTAQDATITGKLTKSITVKSLYGEKADVLWSKTLSSQDTPLSGKGQVKVKDVLADSLASSRAYLENAFLETKLEPGSIVEMTFAYSGEIGKGSDKIPFEGSQKVIIPMTLDIFKMEVQKAGEVTGTLTKPIVSGSASNLDLKLVGMIGLVFALLGLLALLMLTKSENERTEYNKELEMIFKTYGERLARLESALPNQHANIISVNEILDLVKISDEIRQPVFYFQVEEDFEEKIEFYVFDESRIYYLVKFGKSDQSIDLFLNRSA